MEVEIKRIYEVKQNAVGETKRPTDVSQVFANGVLVGYVYDEGAAGRFAGLLHPILTEKQFTVEQRKECIESSEGRLTGSISPPRDVEEYGENIEQFAAED